MSTGMESECVEFAKYSRWIALSLILTCLQLFVFWILSSNPNLSTSFEAVRTCDPPSNTSNDNSILIPTYPIRGPLPWNVLNEELKSTFTLNGTVRVEHSYLFGRYPVEPGVPIVYSGHLSADFVKEWTKSEIERMIGIVKQGNPQNCISSYGPVADELFYTAFKKYPVKGLNVLVIGSERPWVESFCIAYGAKRVTTVDFNVPTIEDANMIRVMSIDDLAKSNEKFDAIFSYSSLEHDGMGRYGDPLNPFGDIERLKRVRNLVLPHGMLFLGVPMGNDVLVWNAHRVYGRIRFALLIQGWKLIESVGAFDFDKLEVEGIVQPIHILEIETIQ